ncbi:MAG: dihydroneopterin aldolase [Bernardetiaceae bacterium]|jgi:dihydroneopterin aldolase|nr:dihydroneopterin aldolase [Bernardetiaceae bacterium]
MPQDLIALEGLEFFAYHGFYPEENKIGNRYGVDVQVETDFTEAALHDKLRETVNYGNLYEIVNGEMAQPAKLLEHLAYKILLRIFARFPAVECAQVSVSKFNPPIGGVCRAAKVTIRRHRHQIPNPLP